MGRFYFDIETLLKEKGISKTQLCINSRIERTQLNNYCKNITKGISLDVLARMCEYLKCTPNDILKYEDEE